MKKIVSAILASTMALSISTTAFAATFTDVTKSNKYAWAYNSVERLVEKKVISVGSDKLYLPEGITTNEQVIAFLGRAIGVNDENNKAVVEAAIKKYDGFLSTYNTFSKNEAALLMYKGLFSQADIETMLSGKQSPVVRHKMAIYITKMMGGEDEVKNKVLVALDYKDTNSIPKSSQGYVEYVKDHNIMKGDTYGNFNPNDSVNRAMIAVMLDSIYTQMNRTYVECELVEVSVNNKIKVRDEDGFLVESQLDSKTSVIVDATAAEIADLKSGQKLVVTSENGKIVEVDAFTIAIDKEIVGIYNGTTEINGGKTGIKVYGNDDNPFQTVTYPVADGALITYNGQVAKFSDITSQAAVVLQIKNSQVIRIDATEKNQTVTGATLLSVDALPPTIVVAHSSGYWNNKGIEIGNGVGVYKNGAISDISNLSKGDIITIYLTYGKITRIDAVSKVEKASGVINEIIISKTPKIKLQVGNEEKIYDISSDVKITLDGQSASIYDLKLGYTVDVKTDSEKVTELSVKLVSGDKSISGVVQSVNPDFNFLQVYDTATSKVENMFVSRLAVILNASNGEKYSLKDIKVGDTIMATGSMNVGNFEAKSIIITGSAK